IHRVIRHNAIRCRRQWYGRPNRVGGDVERRDSCSGTTTFRPAVKYVGSLVIRTEDSPDRMIEAAHWRAGIDAAGQITRGQNGNGIRVITEGQQAIAIVTADNGAGSGNRDRGKNRPLMKTKSHHGARRRGRTIY